MVDLQGTTRQISLKHIEKTSWICPMKNSGSEQKTRAVQVTFAPFIWHNTAMFSPSGDDRRSIRIREDPPFVDLPT